MNDNDNDYDDNDNDNECGFDVVQYSTYSKVFKYANIDIYLPT